jgi:hypothetical protein
MSYVFLVQYKSTTSVRLVLVVQRYGNKINKERLCLFVSTVDSMHSISDRNNDIDVQGDDQTKDLYHHITHHQRFQ